MTQEDIQKLQESMRLCFKYDGPYDLSSGRQSEYYYFGKHRTLDPPTAFLIGNLLLDVVLDSRADAVGGMESGSIPISDAVGIAAHLRGHTLPTFYVRQERKQHGTRERVAQALTDAGAEILSPGRRVAIVDDVLTTGTSIKEAIDVVQGIGCVVSLVIVLVERHEGGGTALRGHDFPVKRLFYTDEKGRLFVDEEFARRTEEAARPRVLSR